MGNCKSNSTDALTEQNLYAVEKKVYLLSGMPEDQIDLRNVEVGSFKNEPVYIRTAICGDASKPKLVFVHGYASSGALFFKCTKPLCKYFNLIYIDIIGMGASSRPQDYQQNFTPEQSIDYFVEYLEKWRIAMGDLKDFYLAGHSFGGYVVGNYAAKYHQHIRKLLLLSPIGIKNDADQGGKTIEEKLAERGGKKPPRFVQAIAKYSWDKKVSPFAAGRALGKRISKKFIKRFVERRQKVDNDEHKMAIIDYQYQIFMRPPTSEIALMINFDMLMSPKISLSLPEKLGRPDFPLPFSFIYGDRDWVGMIDDGASEKLIVANQYYIEGGKKPTNTTHGQFHIIPTSDHNMHMDNSIAFANAIINDLIEGAAEPVMSVGEYQNLMNIVQDVNDYQEDFENEVQNAEQEEQIDDT